LPAPITHQGCIAARRISVLATSLLISCVGCHARQLGSTVSPTRATRVDHSWVIAARSCWPALNSESEGIIAASLLDPIGFRGAFAGFAGYSDSEVEQMVAAPLLDAPPSDTSFLRNAASAPLTREQAIASQAPTRTAEVTPDSLCIVRSGTPVGFR
jgi:hypothetical protein